MADGRKALQTISSKNKVRCPRDATHHVQSRGKQIFCHDCGAKGVFYEKNVINEIPPADGSYSFHSDGENAIVQAGTDELIRNIDDLVRVCRIDDKVWEVERHTVGVNSGYRKNKKSDWHVRDGKVIAGDVVDTGEIIRAPLYNVKAWLKRKTEEIKRTGAVEDAIEELRKKSPKVHKIKYKKFRDGCIFELDMPDLHLGKLALEEESGQEYNIEIASKMALCAVEELLSQARNYRIKGILLPWGNDFFNVDTSANTTTAGTPQQEETLFRRTFKLGRLLTQNVIDMCSQVAPVDVVFMPGNHDKNRTYFLGEVMSAYYDRNKNVSIDNSPISRKYRHYERVLIGFAHGEEKFEKLPSTMFIANKAILGQTEFREWHLGHQHHKKAIEFRHNEELACTLRYLSSLTANDQWHFDNQYIGQVRSASAFLWNPQRGLQAEFHALGE